MFPLFSLTPAERRALALLTLLLGLAAALVCLRNGYAA
jgi:hypothetical protein